MMEAFCNEHARAAVGFTINNHLIINIISIQSADWRVPRLKLVSAFLTACKKVFAHERT